MTDVKNKLMISTPGRICLYGEHQDYLYLPVIAAAISLRISITGERRKDKIIYLNLPDISQSETFKIDEPLLYTKDRDYFKSSINILLRKGYTFFSGFNCIVEGKIPVNAGTSSSTALVVTWINFLTRMSDQSEELPPEQLARYAYEAEVLEFTEPGGMMDHYSTAFGGIISINFYREISVHRIAAPLKYFVLGNSNEPKDTKYILANVKNRIIEVDKILKKFDINFSLFKINQEELSGYEKFLSDSQFKLLSGTVENRDITKFAGLEMNKINPDNKTIGELLNKHQEILREVLHVSTPKIDRMIEAALNSGAYGAKINGSGGGGCMFAYAPEDPVKVKEAVESAGGEAFIVEPDEGSRTETMEER
jgi:galactokinase